MRQHLAGPGLGGPGGDPRPGPFHRRPQSGDSLQPAGFYPQFVLNDLPTTSRDLAFQARDTAQAAGLKRVRLGNLHLVR